MSDHQVSVEQLLIITFFEVILIEVSIILMNGFVAQIIFFAFNEQINVEAFKISDMGGSGCHTQILP